MDASSLSANRRVTASLASCFGVGSIPIAAYVALWAWVAPQYYLFLVLGTYLSLGVFAVLQVFRAIRMGRWTRRVGALALVVGVTATIFLGLRPRPDCLDVGPCARGLTLHPFQLALGMVVVTVSLHLDLGSRANPFVGE